MRKNAFVVVASQGSFKAQTRQTWLAAGHGHHLQPHIFLLTMSPPHSALSVDVSQPEASVARLLFDLFSWPPSSFTVSAVHGGITNALFRATHTSGEVALVRVFGSKTESVIDRGADEALFARLSSAGFAPSLLGTFAGGRVERFLPSRPLLPYEMGLTSPTDFVSKIAREVSRLHALDGAVTGAPPGATPVLFQRLESWLDAALAIEWTDSAEHSGRAACIASCNLAQIRGELNWLKTVLPSEGNGHGQVLLDALRARLLGEGKRTEEAEARVAGAALAYRSVFAHNDLLSGNVLLLDGGESILRLIDYEYAATNHLGYEVANHWCEVCGFDFDLELFPSEGIRLRFLESYSAAAGVQGTSPDFFRECLRASTEFILASHLWWGLWAVLQAYNSGVDFNFAAYAVKRLQAYFTHKREYFQILKR
jgi:ethanolamine kinase